MPDDPTAAPTDLHWLTIADASRLIERRRLSPVELTDALIARAEALDPQLNAFLLPTPEKAREQARAAEREIMAGSYRGPLHGIPFGLKDIYATAGIRTTSHSKICENLVPTEDATTVTKLYQAGAVLLGKLATHEFAHGGPSFDLPWPPARNPWNRDHFTGGSSSGAGAAVAAGFVPGALGSDTGGSIRGPAALCGIVGLKPTYGLVSRAGVYANSFTFDHAGPMTWTVEDCAIMLQAIAGHDPKDPASADRPIPDYRAALTGDIRGLRIGIVGICTRTTLPSRPRCGPPSTKRMPSSARSGPFWRMCGSGRRRIITRSRSPSPKASNTRSTRRSCAARPGDFGADFLGRALPAVLYSGTDYVQAQRERRLMLAEMAPIYDKFDVLVTPAAGTGAPARYVADHQLLAEFVADDAVQRHRRPRRSRNAWGLPRPACRCRCSLPAARSTRRPCCAPPMPTRRPRTGGSAGPVSTRRNFLDRTAAGFAAGAGQRPRDARHRRGGVPPCRIVADDARSR